MNDLIKLTTKEIQNRIYTLRGFQIMLDQELAAVYEVETKVLNQAVKRNIERFPENFCFQIKEDELEILRSQSVTSSWGGRRYLPYVFTEQGVAMLSAVLRSKTAVRVSVQLMNAFVNMRRFIATNAQVFQRLDTLELKQIQNDQKIDKVLTAIESKTIQPKQGIFYDGQIFDAWKFVSDLIRSAKKSIVLIDNYVDDTVLTLFEKRKKGVPVTLLTKNISKQLTLDIKKFNKQYSPVEVKEFSVSHDRFLILDDFELYHFGASLKDLGKKWFAFSKMDMEAVSMLENLKRVNKNV
ncbi:MAG: ORF6N domain-containing protein [Bacteroidales bacterium]|nr:ORF6N domain-containing protein [Bacteroidales bacterium]